MDKTIYKKTSLKIHPDKNPNCGDFAAAKFKELGVNKINAQTFHAAAKRQLEEYWKELSMYWQDKGYKDEFPTLISESSKIRSENQYWIIRGIAQSVIKQADLVSKVKRVFDSELNQALSSNARCFFLLYVLKMS